jgi:hypothetical protein
MNCNFVAQKRPYIKLITNRSLLHIIAAISVGFYNDFFFSEAAVAERVFSMIRVQ